VSEYRCTTCGDRAVAMTVLRADCLDGLGVCAAEDGAHLEVELSLLDRIRPGDRVLVHAGVAIQRLGDER
jgi:hydrogenase maturation factor